MLRVSRNKMSNLADCIKNEQIIFKCGDKVLDTKLRSYGKYCGKLIQHLSNQYNSAMVVRGIGLGEFLSDKENLYDLTDFLIGMAVKLPVPLLTHIRADIEKLEQHYSESSQQLTNLTGDVEVNYGEWIPQMQMFEKEWNIALCTAWGGFVGYPGYEWPKTEDEFKECVASHAQNFVIGTPRQLKRYWTYCNFTEGEYEQSISTILTAFGIRR